MQIAIVGEVDDMQVRMVEDAQVREDVLVASCTSIGLDPHDRALRQVQAWDEERLLVEASLN